MIIAQNTFTIKRIAKDEFNLILSPETMAIPATADGVADLTNAEFSVRVTKGGKELFPVFDESIGARNLLTGSAIESPKVGEYRVPFEFLPFFEDAYQNNYPLTISFDAKFEEFYDQPTAKQMLFYDFPDLEPNKYRKYEFIYPNNYKYLNLEDTYSRHSYYNTPFLHNPDALYSWLHTYGGAKIRYRVKNWKLEKGNNPNPVWTPAPEDILKYATITPYNCSAAVVGDKIKITSLTPGKDAGYVDVTVTYGEGFVDTKRFTWAKAKSGISVTLTDVEFAKNTNPTTPPSTGWTTTAPVLAEGEQLWTRTKTAYSSGNPTYTTPANITPKTGTGIESVTEEYAISASKTVQPTTGWSTTQPAWVNGQYIWSRVKVVYKNPTSTVYTGYAVSSEWEAVNDLKIGGRNTYHNSVQLAPYIGTVSNRNVGETINGFTFTEISPYSGSNYVRLMRVVTENGWWTVSFDVKSNNTGGARVDICDLGNTIFQITNKYKRIELSVNVDRYGDGSVYHFVDIGVLESGDFSIDVRNIKVEKGNKATDWSPAPEDVQARIDLAKQEALTAAGNAQTSANSANTAVGNLNTYVDNAFKDGVIEASEAKAIEKYINIVNTEKANLEATYNTLYVNTYLEGTAKTNLLNAKVTYFGAVDNLLNAINSAIADGKTTVSEKQNVDAKYNSYKSALASLQTAIENTNKAIQTKLDSLSTERSDILQTKIDAEKSRINDILSDNIADPSEKQYLSNLWQEIYAEYPRIWTQAYNYGIDRSAYETAYTNLNNTLSPVLANLNTSTSVSGATIRARFSAYYDARIQIQNAITNKVNQNAGDAGTTAADAQAKANEAAAITDKFGTIPNGGLFSSVMILLRELNSMIETAGISGIQNGGYAPAYWSGGTYQEALAFSNLVAAIDSGVTPIPPAILNAKMANIVHLHNGTSKSGELITNMSGNIYTLKNGIVRFELNSNDLPYISSLRDQSEINRTAYNDSHSFAVDSDEYIFPNSIEVVENNSSVSIQAQIETTAFSDDSPPVVYSTSVFLFLIKSDGTNYATVGFVSANTNSTRTNDVDRLLTGVPKGIYRLKVIYTNDSGHYSASGYVSASVMKSQFKTDVKKFMIGQNGLMAYYGVNKYIYLNENENIFFGLRGTTDTPGVLCAGRIASNANVQASWGAKKNRPGYQYVSVEKISTGRYRVHHSIGHTDYIPKLTGGVWLYSGNKRSGCPGFENVQAYSFDVFIMTDGGDPVDCAFAYECTGNNWV